jgi:hypothetical protein
MEVVDDLPEGWIATYDNNYNCMYYHNMTTGESQWHHPREPPPSHVEMGSHTESAVALGDGTQAEATHQEHGGLPSHLTGDDDASLSLSEDEPEGLNNLKIKGQIGESLEENTSMSAKQARGPSVGGKSQDYLHLAQTYKNQRVYCDSRADLTCVLCRQRLCLDVFFPCQHRCVCPECIVTHQICEHQHLILIPNGFFNCPLCGTIIKKIIPSAGGEEVEEYWKWVHAVNPELPEGFMRNFRHSAAVIEKIYMHDIEDTNQTKSKTCNIS